MAGNFTSNVRVNNNSYQTEVPDKKKRYGTLVNKLPLFIDSRTTVYVSKNLTDAEIQEIKNKYLTNGK